MNTIKKQLLKEVICSALLLASLAEGNAQEGGRNERFSDPYKYKSYTERREKPKPLSEEGKKIAPVKKKPEISITSLLQDKYGNPTGPSVEEAEIIRGRWD